MPAGLSPSCKTCKGRSFAREYFPKRPGTQSGRNLSPLSGRLDAEDREREGKILIPISAEIAHSISVDLKKGSRILFDDGKIATRCIAVAPPEMVVEIEVGGKLTSNKGMNLPGTPLSMSCLTEKDLEDLKFGIEQGVDAVALSFVRTVQDIEDLRSRSSRRRKTLL